MNERCVKTTRRELVKYKGYIAIRCVAKGGQMKKHVLVNCDYSLAIIIGSDQGSDSKVEKNC